MSLLYLIDVYLDKFGYEIREDEIDKMCEDVNRQIKDIEDPDYEDIADHLTDYVEDSGLYKFPKVKRSEKDGCKWISLCGVRKAMHCNIEKAAGETLCKYHNYRSK